MKNFSIAIWTYKRHHLLERILSFYDKNIPIYIADGSNSSFKFDRSQNTNIYYYHLPKKSPQKRIKYLLNTIKSKYIIFCADDDLLNISTIEKIIRVMEKEKSPLGGAEILELRLSIFGSSNFHCMYDNNLLKNKSRTLKISTFYDLQKNNWQIFNFVFKTITLKDFYNNCENFLVEDFITYEELLKIYFFSLRQKKIFFNNLILSYRNKYSKFNSTRFPQASWIYQPHSIKKFINWLSACEKNKHINNKILSFLSGFLISRLFVINKTRYPRSGASFYKSLIKRKLINFFIKNKLYLFVARNNLSKSMPSHIYEEVHFRLSNINFWIDAD